MIARVDHGIIVTKLKIPYGKPNAVQRPHLLTQLDDCLKSRLTLVCAPSGFGKTSLVGQWCTHPNHGANSALCGWYSIDAADDDPAPFFAHFLAALGMLEPMIQDYVMEVLPSLQLSIQGSKQAKPTPTLYLSTILNVADHFNGTNPIVLVLEDYHLIQDPIIHESITFLLDRLPSTFHIIILTRTDPPLPLARLRARGELVELRADALRLTRQETEIFYKQTFQIPLTTEAIALLDSRLEGWLAGLQLTALVIRGELTRAQGYHSPIQPALQHEIGVDELTSLHGSQRYIADYFNDEVFRLQSPETQQFLLVTGVLDRFCGSLCDALLDIAKGDSALNNSNGETGQAILERLENENVFIFPLDDRREWYRFHPLFAEMLRRELDQMNRAIIPELNRRASLWYESKGNMDDAIRYGLRAADGQLDDPQHEPDSQVSTRDYDRVAMLIESYSMTLLIQSELIPLLDLINHLPESIVRTHPILCVRKAWSLLVIDAFASVEDYLASAEIKLKVHDPKAAKQSNNAAIHVEILTIRASMAAIRENPDEVIGYAQQAQELLRIMHGKNHIKPLDMRAEQFIRNALALNLGSVYVALSDIEQAIAELTPISTLQGTGGDRYITVSALCALATIALNRGANEEAITRCHQAIQCSTLAGGISLPMAGMGYITLGRVLMQTSHSEEALTMVLRGLALADSWWVSSVSITGYILLGEIYWQLSDPDAAQVAFDMAKSLEQAQSSRQQINEFRKIDEIEDDEASAPYSEDMLAFIPNAPSLTPAKRDELSGRELEVVRLIAAGETPQQIADRFVLSIGTVRNHLKSIYNKLDAHTRVQMLHKARTFGYL